MNSAAGPRAVLAQDAEVAAERLLAAEAGGAVPARHAGIHHHAIARVEALHVGADRVHDAGGVGPHHVRERERHARKTVGEHQVEPVDGGRVDPDPDVGALAQLGRGDVPHLERVDARRRGERERAHQKAGVTGCSAGPSRTGTAEPPATGWSTSENAARSVADVIRPVT
jgi:hypothetical protein